MATFLFAWELGAGTGHCVNLLPIAAGLLARGHRVFAAVRDLPTASSVFGDLPVDYLQAPILQGRPPELVEFTRTFADILHNNGYGDDQALAALVAAWRTLLGFVKPSVVLCEHAPTALLASRCFDVRRAIIGTGFFSPPDETPLRELSPGMPPTSLGAHPDREQMVLDRINRILTNGSRPALERVTQLYSDADANFLLTLPELDHFGPRSEVKYRGMWSPSGGAAPDWPPGEGPRVFAYLMPPQRAWQPLSLLNALRTLKNPTVVYAPFCDQRLLETVEASNIRIQKHRCDMDLVVQQAAVAIGHGNNGTTTQVLLGGVRQLLIPLVLEQFIFSRRVEATGAGLLARPDSTEHQIGQLTNVLHDSRITAAAAAFAEKYETFDGHASATSIVDELESLALY